MICLSLFTFLLEILISNSSARIMRQRQRLNYKPVFPELGNLPNFVRSSLILIAGRSQTIRLPAFYFLFDCSFLHQPFHLNPGFGVIKNTFHDLIQFAILAVIRRRNEICPVIFNQLLRSRFFFSESLPYTAIDLPPLTVTSFIHGTSVSPSPI